MSLVASKFGFASCLRLLWLLCKSPSVQRRHDHPPRQPQRPGPRSSLEPRGLVHAHLGSRRQPNNRLEHFNAGSSIQNARTKSVIDVICMPSSSAVHALLQSLRCKPLAMESGWVYRCIACTTEISVWCPSCWNHWHVCKHIVNWSTYRWLEQRARELAG